MLSLTSGLAPCLTSGDAEWRINRFFSALAQCLWLKKSPKYLGKLNIYYNTCSISSRKAVNSPAPAPPSRLAKQAGCLGPSDVDRVFKVNWTNSWKQLEAVAVLVQLLPSPIWPNLQPQRWKQLLQGYISGQTSSLLYVLSVLTSPLGWSQGQ